MLKHQLIISSRARRRAPNRNSFDRFGGVSPLAEAFSHDQDPLRAWAGDAQNKIYGLSLQLSVSLP
jgi:hypothetical protein